MPYCPNCGIEVSEVNNFCLNCGTPLRAEDSFTRTEKMEKQEKGEKHEKGEANPVASLMGGVILILLGLFYYLNAFRIIVIREAWPYVFILLGLVIIIASIYAGVTASKEFPRP